MPRVTSTTHASTAKHSSYTSAMLNDSHSVLEDIRTNTANTNINVGDVEINTQQLEDLTTISNTKLQSIDDRLHGSIGHTENTISMGDGSDQLRAVGLGYDRTNQKVRSILVDSGGKQVVDNPTFDALIGHTNNTISVGDGSNQLRVVPLGYDRSGGKARSLNVDSDGHLQSDILSSALPTGASTSANQSTINTTIGTGNTTLSTMNTNIVSTNSKLDTLDGSINTLEACVGSNKVNVNISSGGTDVSALATHVKQDTLNTSVGSVNTSVGSLITANHTDLVALEASLTSMETKQDTQVTHLSEIEGAVETLEACVGSNKVNVNISSGGTDVSGLSTHAKQDTIIGHLDGVEGKLDTLETTLTEIATDGNNIQTLLSTLDGVQDNALTKLGEIETSADALISANHTDLVALEASLTSMEGKQDTQVTHLSEIEGAVETIEACVSSNKVNVNIASGTATDVSALSTHAKQDTIIGHLDGVEGKLDTLETTLTEIATDGDNIQSLLTTLDGVQDNALTKLGEIETTNNANQVLITATNGKLDDIETAVQILDNIVIAEDTAHSSGDAGVMALGVHQTTATALGANGDYTPLSVNGNQHLRTTKELFNFSYTFPSSGTIGSGNMAESNVLTFQEKVSSGGYTFFVTSSGTANHEVGIVLKGSMDGSAYFTINSSLYATGLYNDGGTTQYFTIKDFNIKNIKIQITNNSSSSDDFEVFVCH